MKSTLVREKDDVENIDAVLLSSHSPLVVELSAEWDVAGSSGPWDGDCRPWSLARVAARRWLPEVETLKCWSPLASRSGFGGRHLQREELGCAWWR